MIAVDIAKKNIRALHLLADPVINLPQMCDLTMKSLNIDFFFPQMLCLL